MGKRILIFIFLITPLALSAQTNTDSLFNTWRDTSLTDSIRVYSFKTYIWDGFLFSRTDSAVVLAREMIDFSEKAGYKKGQALGSRLLGIAEWVLGDYAKAIQSYKTSLKISEEIGDRQNLGATLNGMGLVYHDQGDYLNALGFYDRSLKISEDIRDLRAMGNTLNNLGLIYHDQGDYDKALEYYERSLKISEELNDHQGIANSLINIGIVYQDHENPDKALEYFNRGLVISEKIGERQLVSNSLNNIGTLYKDSGEYDRALDYFFRSLKIKQQLQDHRGIGNTSNNIGIAYHGKGMNDKAIENCSRALSIGRDIGSLEVQREACDCLYRTYRDISDNSRAIGYLERIVAIDDSLDIVGTAKKLQQMEFEKVMLKDSLEKEKEKILVRVRHDEEMREKNRQRNIILGSGILALLLAGGFFSRWRYVKNANEIISREKDRSETLLLNILPAEIAEELKINGRADARDFDQVSILFTDFKGFTSLSETMDARELVGEIDHCFKAFDSICEKYGVEKIKTIGDAYMAAGGLPVPDDDATRKVVLAALEMATFIVNRKKEREATGRPGFEMRAGIHTGNVVAGIVGVKKFQYDIWGDTVNTASRMESQGEPGEVNISQATYEGIMHDPAFAFIPRGTVEVKGKGSMDMYFVREAANSRKQF